MEEYGKSLPTAAELKNTPSNLAPILAGAIAGISVDLILYPLDTVKTRLQSSQGFHKAGGFKSVYKGLSAVACTSMPITSLFFASYEGTKRLLQPYVTGTYAPLVHMFAASVGEVLACSLRVPAEIVKQRKQTYVGAKMKSNLSILLDAIRKEGVRKGLYRGYAATLFRDLPFSFIELPVWEFLKDAVKIRNNGEITPLQSALCGSLAGSFAAAMTTPFDLAQTRIMLSNDQKLTGKTTILPVLTGIYSENGVRGLFFGVLPRVSAFFLGGFVFLGTYDYCKRFFENNFER